MGNWNYGHARECTLNLLAFLPKMGGGGKQGRLLISMVTVLNGSNKKRADLAERKKKAQ